MKKPSLILLGDYMLFREGLKLMLDTYADFNVVRETSCTPLVIPLIKELKPDIVICDLDPVSSTAEILVPHLCRLSRVLLLSSDIEHLPVQKIIDQGVNALLSKNCSIPELAAAAWRVAIGCSFFSDMALPLKPALAHSKVSKKPVTRRLSERQTQVARLVALGRTSREIAEQLCIAVKTVDRHRSDILKRLNLPNASAIANYVSAGVLG